MNKKIIYSLFFLLFLCSVMGFAQESGIPGLSGAVFGNSEKKRVNKMLESIKGQCALDDKGNVSYQRIVDVSELKKDSIYNRALFFIVNNYGGGIKSIEIQMLQEKMDTIPDGAEKRLVKNLIEASTGVGENYFVYSRGRGKSNIMLQDKQNGQLISEGLYEDVHSFEGSSDKSKTFNLSTWHIVKIDVEEGKAKIDLTLTNYNLENDHTVLLPNGIIKSRLMSVKDEYPINEKGDKKNEMGQGFYKSHVRAIATLDAITVAIRK